MRICRYRAGDTERWGVVDGDGVHELQGDPFGEHRIGELVGDLADVELLAPCEPTKVVCVGRNYRSLLAEQGRPEPATPFLFLKASTAVVGPGAAVLYPENVSDVAHEGELAVVIGRQARQLREDEVDKFILGYTAANDITVRDWQDPSAQWWRAKSSDSHCPLGPWIETDLPDPHAVRVRTLVNGEVRQDGRTDDLVFTIPQLLAHITAHMTLLPGDVVLTGTAAGIRPVRPGDVMSVEVQGLGTLTNPVVASAAAGATP
jgi:2-keto-4-pentenoate hydratase/2-oxohepta-3-ene-1,7-dioic acid hydratase in catechol pathway